MILIQQPEQTYSAQRRVVTYPSQLDPGWKKLRITLTRVGWPDLGLDGDGRPVTLVSIGFELSIDNGENWQSWGSGACPGGIPGLSKSIIEMPLDNTVGISTRRVRAIVDNVAPIDTAITVEAF